MECLFTMGVNDGHLFTMGVNGGRLFTMGVNDGRFVGAFFSMEVNDW